MQNLQANPLLHLNLQLDHSPLPHSPLHHLQSLLTKLGLPVSRSPHCIHRGSCHASVIVASLKAGFVAYGIKFMLGMVFSLKKLLSNPAKLKQMLTDKSAIAFGLFVGTFTMVFRVLVCGLRRRVGKQYEKYLYLLGGFVGAIVSVLFLEKSTRQALGLFLFVRALDSTYQSLVKKGYLPQSKYFYIFVYSLSMVVTGYCFMNQPGTLSSQTHGFYKNFTNETIAEMQARQITIERKNAQLALRGIAPQNPLDYIPKLKAYYQKIHQQ